MRCIIMTSNEKLVEYILSLTDEQIEKLFNRPSAIVSKPEEHDPLLLRISSLQIQ